MPSHSWAEALLATKLRHRHTEIGLLDEPNQLLGGQPTVSHVQPLRVTDSA